MFWGRIPRMILIELSKVFLLSLIALTGLILLCGIIAEAMKSGLGPVQVLTAVPLLLPSLLPYTVPTTSLFATCMAYGRLSADNEILAIKAAGIHIRHVLGPAVLLGVLASGATFFLSLDIIPYTHFFLRSHIVGDADELLYNMLRRDGCIKHPRLKYEIHVKSIQGRTLHEVIFKRHGPSGKGFDIIACAKEARLSVNLEEKHVLVEMRNCQIVDGSVRGVLENRIFPLEIPADWSGSLTKVRSTDMTWSELQFFEIKFQEEQLQMDREIEAQQARIERGRGGPQVREHVSHLINERRLRESYVQSIRVERHLRVALALGCLCFTLIGCPVGIWLSKNDYLSSFVSCFLPIVTVYYPLLFCMINMARANRIDSWLGIHLANVLLLLAGASLFHRLARQ